jgi:hypothetical protein
MTPTVYNRELLHEVNDKVRGYLAAALPGPGSKTGLVLTDLDVVHRVYGDDFSTDGKGRIIVVEFKRGGGYLTDGQYNTFGLMDRLMTQGDNDGARYGGFWHVNYLLDIDDMPVFTYAERLFLPAWQKRCFVEGHDAVMELLRTGIGPKPSPEMCPF